MTIKEDKIYLIVRDEDDDEVRISMKTRSQLWKAKLVYCKSKDICPILVNLYTDEYDVVDESATPKELGLSNWDVLHIVFE